nr:Zinc finger LIM type [Hymenolepis microstoma]
MTTDGETWQLNLESWRERRRAATRAMTQEMQQVCSPSPPPTLGITEPVDRPVTLPSSGINIRETLRKFKTLERSSTSDADRRFITQKDINSVSSGIVKNSPFLLSDAEKAKQLANGKADKRPPPIRIRLVYNSDCVKADNLGLVVGAEGADDGPPFVIRGFVKNSMAERGNLQVGDELLSVDNLCCTYTSDRPLLIKNLTKLHQELQRLTNKQRPVEVKVFREKAKDKAKISQTPADRVRTNENSTRTVETKKDASLFSGSSHSIIDEIKHPQIETNERSSRTNSPDPQKPQPINRTEYIVPATEQVKLEYEDRYLSSSIPSRKDMSSKTSTVMRNYEPSHPVIEPVNSSTVETVITRDSPEDGMESYSQKRHQRLISQIRINRSYSPAFEPSNIPPPPEPGSSDSLIVTPSESPPSIVTIQPPPTPPLVTVSSNIDQQLSIITPLPPPPPIETSNLQYQYRYPEVVIDNTSSKSVSNSTANYSTLPTKKASSSNDLLRSDMDTYRRDYVQYGSDINIANERALVKPSTSVGYGWRSEMNIYGGVDCRPKDTSDIDSGAEVPYQQLNRPKAKEEGRKPYEEVNTKFLPSIKANEKLRYSNCETLHFPQSAIGIEKPEVRNPETVSLPPIEVKEGKQPTNTSTNSTMRRNEKRDNEHRIHKKLKPASKRIPSDPALRQQNMRSNRQSRVNVIGTWYNCASCNQQLGSSDLMIIEELGLFYHLSCFNCFRCGIQLGDGQNETSVRIKNGKIYCYICYHRLSKSLTRSKDRSKTRNSHENLEQNSSISKTLTSLEAHTNTSTSHETSNHLKSIKR